MYSPVALVVEDDRHFGQHVHRGFLNDTSLGVLEANDLQSAYKFIHNPLIKIDVILADIGFDRDTKDENHDLHDGLDFIEEASKVRPDIQSYVLSVNAKDPLLQGRAKDRKLPIEDWFEKLAPVANQGLLPWAKVERACLVKALKRDNTFRERARAVGIEVRDIASDEAIAEKVRKALILPRLTYINRLPDDYLVIKPIEVLCVKDGENTFRATAIEIGLVTEGEGASAEDAIDNLGQLIANEVALLDSEKGKFVGYAAHIKEMLKKFVRQPKTRN